MAKINVYRPDEKAPPPEPFELAPRGDLPVNPVLTLVENGKPKAMRLLQLVGDRVRDWIPGGSVEIFRKPSAGKSITPDEARSLAARSHLIITGVGD